jgi:hypothetical protein
MSAGLRDLLDIQSGVVFRASYAVTSEVLLAEFVFLAFRQ